MAGSLRRADARVDNHYKERGFRLLLFFFTTICGIIANVNRIHVSEVESLLYPVNLDLSTRLVVVVGGGAVAERKVAGLLAADADVSVHVIAPQVTEGLRTLTESRRIDWRQERYAYGVLEGAFIVYAATDSSSVNAAIAAEAKERGILVNVIDDSHASSFQIPSSVRRGDFLLTVSTGGRSPAFSRAIRMELEQIYPPSFGLWLERVALLRNEMQKELPTSRERTVFWRMALRPTILNMIRDGELEKAEVELRNAALDIGAKSSNGSG